MICKEDIEELAVCPHCGSDDIDLEGPRSLRGCHSCGKRLGAD